MYEIFAELLRKKGVKAAAVSKATGIHPSTFSDWKSGKSRPKQEKLIKIAAYFNVTVDYLLNREENRVEKSTVAIDRDTYDIISTKPMQMLITTFMRGKDNDRLSEHIELMLAFHNRDTEGKSGKNK